MNTAGRASVLALAAVVGAVVGLWAKNESCDCEGLRRRLNVAHRETRDFREIAWIAMKSAERNGGPVVDELGPDVLGLFYQPEPIEEII